MNTQHFLQLFLSLNNVDVQVPVFQLGRAAAVERIQRPRHSNPLGHLYVQTNFTGMGLK